MRTEPPTPTTIEEIQPFCAQTFQSRPALERPFIQKFNGRADTLATDGRVLVVLPSQQLPWANPNCPLGAIPNDGILRVHIEEAIASDDYDFNLSTATLPNPRFTKRYESGDYDWANDEVTFDSTNFALRYIWKMQKCLPDVWLAPHSCPNLYTVPPLRFRFAGGYGLLMPCNYFQAETSIVLR